MAGISLPGLGTGMDTETMVSQLMQLESRPQLLLQNRRTSAKNELAAWGTVGASMDKLAKAAASLTEDKNWLGLTAGSSDTAIATTSLASASTATAGTTGGQMRFKVDQLAAGGSLVSAGTISGLDTVVATSSLLVGRGTSPLGFSQLTASGLAAGSYNLTVTQSSTAATVTGTAPAGTVVVDGTNDTVEATVNGVASTFTLAHGTYSTAAQLATALGAAMGSQVQVDTTGGALRIATARQGSQASVQVTGGTALGDLGLVATASPATGGDARVSLGGVSTTVDTVETGGTITLAGPDGATVSATLSGPLVAGTTSLSSVDVGGGTLSEVVNAVNRSTSGVRAAAVQVGTDTYRLQLSSTSTGAGSDPMVSAGALSGVTLVQLSAGRDARITAGEGVNAFQVTSSTNTFNGLIPGVNVTVVKPSADLVTVTADVDGNALAGKVQAMLDAFNGVVNTVKAQTVNASDPKSPPPLAGDGVARRLGDQLYSMLSQSGTTTVSMRSLGISVARDGLVNFDSSKFIEAYNANPSGVADVFKKVTTFTDSRLSTSTLPSTVPAGSYTVSVTTAATRATVTGATFATLTGAESISVNVGDKTATYAASAGETPAQVAAGLNAALADKAMGVTVDVSGSALRVRMDTYGSAYGFNVSSDAAGSGQTGLVATAGGISSAAGTDVAGTFTRGSTTVLATGRGQLLTADSTDSVLKGLSVRVAADGADAPVFSPSAMTYRAGLAQALNVAATNSSGTSGVVGAAKAGRDRTIKTLDTQIGAWTDRLKQREATLRATFTRLESSVSKSKSAQSWLSSQISGLQASSSSGR